MLSVIEKKCEWFDTGNKSGKIVVASDKPQGNLAIEELHTAAARNLAISHAQTTKGGTYGVSGSLTVYPVDEKGIEMKEIKPGVTPAAYYADIPVTVRFS